MVKTEMEIIFYPTNSISDSYDVEKIRGLTFMLDVGENYIGFVSTEDNIEKYIFGNMYKIIVRFPSLVEKNSLRFFNKWINDNRVSICLGSKIIGEGKILSYSFDVR